MKNTAAFLVTCLAMFPRGNCWGEQRARCQGTTEMRCADFTNPEDCLLMGCQAVLIQNSDLCRCKSKMKDCQEFMNNSECDLAQCEWVEDPTPTPTPTPEPSVEPTPTPTSVPTPEPSIESTPTPTSVPTPEPSS